MIPGIRYALLPNSQENRFQAKPNAFKIRFLTSFLRGAGGQVSPKPAMVYF
jgi:hypothetical protein